MHMNTSKSNPIYLLCSTPQQKQHSKGPRARAPRRTRGRLTKEKALRTNLKIKNLKLYVQNQSIIEENRRLREKALLLHQENRALLSQLQNVSPANNHKH